MSTLSNGDTFYWEARKAAILEATAHPEVGTLATVGIGSDRYATTVEYVSKSGNTIRTDSPHVTFRRHGQKFTARKGSGFYVVLGIAETYLDPSF